MYQFLDILEPGDVKILVPCQDSFFHCLARASGSQEYLNGNRDKIAEQMRLQLKDEIKDLDSLSADVIDFMGLYLNVSIEIINIKGKRKHMTKVKGNYLIRILKDVSQYYLLGNLGEDKMMKVRF